MRVAHNEQQELEDEDEEEEEAPKKKSEKRKQSEDSDEEDKKDAKKKKSSSTSDDPGLDSPFLSFLTGTSLTHWNDNRQVAAARFEVDGSVLLQGVW